MSYGEQYQPTGSERFGFKKPDIHDELIASELEIDQPYELEMYMQKLKMEYSDAIAQKIPFMAAGTMVDIDEFTIEEEFEIFYGRIKGFKIYDSLGQYRIVAQLKDDTSGQTRNIVISGRDGLESVLLADNLSDDIDVNTQEWQKIRSRCFDGAEFLGNAATKMAFIPFDAASADKLTALEEIIADDYGVRKGRRVYIEGIQTLKVDTGETIIAQDRLSFATEASHTGTFLGLTLYEVTTTHNRKEVRLCIAVELDDNTVVLQPCHTAHRVENLEQV